MTKAKNIKNRVVSYINDLKENGLKNIKQKIKDSFSNLVSTFKSPENFKQMVASLKDRLSSFSLNKVSSKIHNYLTYLNDYLYGIN